MSEQVRLRRHTDGRVALHTPNAYRFSWFCRNEDNPKCQWLTDDEVIAPGWSELFVAELPEPDGESVPIPTREVVFAALEHENFCRWPDHRGCCNVTVEDCTCNVTLNIRTMESMGWLTLRDNDES